MWADMWTMDPTVGHKAFLPLTGLRDIQQESGC